MKLDNIPVTEMPNFKGGEKSLRAKMFWDGANRILMDATLAQGASIGWHKHESSSEIIYILSGTGHMVTENGEEILRAGDCHYCPKGQSHSLRNDEPEELVFFAVVPEQ